MLTLKDEDMDGTNLNTLLHWTWLRERRLLSNEENTVHVCELLTHRTKETGKTNPLGAFPASQTINT